MSRVSKAALRSMTLKRLKAVDQETRLAESQVVLDMLMANKLYRDAQHVGLFISMDHEIDTMRFIDASLTQGKRVFVPRTHGKHMSLLEVKTLREIDAYVQTKWGIPEPPEDGRDALEEVDDAAGKSLVVMPGVAFHLDGGRIGYGGGFYDRYLNHLNASRAASGLDPIATIGIGLRCQLVRDEIPMDIHDVRIDHILTPPPA